MIPLQIELADDRRPEPTQMITAGSGLQSPLLFGFLVFEDDEPLILTPEEFARGCQSAACRPPTSGGTGGSGRGTGGVTEGSIGRIPSRLPKEGGDQNTSLRISDLSPDNVEAQVARLHAVGAIPAHLKGAEEVITWMQGNIQSVLDQVPASELEAGRKWYESANNVGKDLATSAGIPHSAANAIIAALSPGTGWDPNMAMARSTVETLRTNPVTSPDVAKYANAEKQASWAKSVAKQQKAQDKARIDLADLEAKRAGETDPKEIKKLDKNIDSKKEQIGRPMPAQPPLDYFKVGDRISDLPTRDAAYLIRAHNPNLAVRVIKPKADGDYDDSEFATNADGSVTSAGWQSYENIAKAVSIFRDPSPETISKAMGEAHKVRTFFNNIESPYDIRNEATIDTHSAGISIGVPLSITHPFIKAGKNSIMSSPSHTADGTSGTYAIMAEAHRRVAVANNLTPNQVQSITWTQWRVLHPPVSRRKVSGDANRAAGTTSGRSSKRRAA